jgi:CDP-Glycerol:Poly(glycerophosphate) glycerophosphotransferase
MSIDAFAFESHFLDHLAPLWKALPSGIRGTFTVDHTLEERAERAGFPVTGADGRTIRRSTFTAPVADPGPGPAALVASYGDIKVARRLGYRRFAFLEHGAGQSYGADRRQGRHGSYAGGEDREDVGLFLVPGEGPAARWRASYPEAEVKVVGSTRLDELPARVPGGEPTVAISFHWQTSMIAELRGALGHFRPVLPDLPRHFRVIGHGHPRAAGELPRLYRRAGIEWVADFDDVCRRADLYVCDNSSTLFEFAATGRPVLVLNAPWYRRDREHGLRFWEAATVGRQVDHPEDLVPAIRDTLADPQADREAREAALRLVYTYRDGAADRAAATVVMWLRREI